MISISITEMAVEVDAPQMPKQLVTVNKPLVAELAEGVTPVRSVVWVAPPSMCAQLRPCVTPSLKREDLPPTAQLISKRKNIYILIKTNPYFRKKSYLGYIHVCLYGSYYNFIISILIY